MRAYLRPPTRKSGKIRSFEQVSKQEIGVDAEAMGGHLRTRRFLPLSQQHITVDQYIARPPLPLQGY